MMSLKKIFCFSVFVFVFIFINSLTFVLTLRPVIAGSLAPSSAPAANSYTLSDIFNRLMYGTTATSGNHDFSPTTTPRSTFHTLTDIYNAIPTIDASKLLSNTTYIGVTGSIAVKTGEALASLWATSTNKITLTPAIGYYDGSSATVSTTSVDFVAENIKKDEQIFGLAGTLVPSGGTATVADVVSGKTFYGATQTDWNLQTGTYVASSPSSGYPGRGWTPNAGTLGVDPGTVPLTEQACTDAGITNWAWFEDGNGDGDTSDPEDGVCVQNYSSPLTGSWNGAVLMTPSTAALNLASSTATGGTTSSISSSTANWTVDVYKNHIAKITMGTAKDCWGIVKSNTADTITVYGYWLNSSYGLCTSAPDATSGLKIYDDNKYDNSWIGDYSCTGNFPNGTVVNGTYPSSGTYAFASTDCLDGKRDLLPNEIDRAVIIGTISATSTDSTTGTSTISDSGLVAGMVDPYVYNGQKVLITSGEGLGSYGIIEVNTTDSFTVSGWSGTPPASGSGYAIVYVIPKASYITTSRYLGGTSDDTKQNNGPINTETLKAWKGTRLPTPEDFMGYCGYKDGGSNYESTSNALSASKTYGNYGGQVGRIDEFMDLANSSYEWLSEPYYYIHARVAGGNACSLVYSSSVYTSYRFRAVFRP